MATTVYPDVVLTSPANPAVKDAVRLRNRRNRDRAGHLLIEGYRELRAALDAGHAPLHVFYCRELFLGSNEDRLLADARAAGARLLETTPPVLHKLSYRDRPDGLVAVAPQLRGNLDDLTLPPEPLLLVAEAIEKPGNLGTMLRSADAAGAAAVIVADPTTDLNNPNVVRASVGTLFSVPTAVATGEAVRAWLRRQGVRIAAATPSAEAIYWDANLTGPLAVVVGTEQLGLSEAWLAAADVRVAIPMHGRADSLNVATAATLLLYEAVRQRLAASGPSI